jgi:hypothetical protein
MVGLRGNRIAGPLEEALAEPKTSTPTHDIARSFRFRLTERLILKELGLSGVDIAVFACYASPRQGGAKP